LTSTAARAPSRIAARLRAIGPAVRALAVAAGEVRRLESAPDSGGRVPPADGAADLAVAADPPAAGTCGCARGTGLDVVERSTKSDSGSGRRGELCVLIPRS